MQGRLSPIVDNKIQSFPWKNWEKEFEIASQNNISTMEWTIDDDNLYDNPLLNTDGIKKINLLSSEYDIKIPSLTGDCFMQNPFWKASGDKKTKLHKDFINILYGCHYANISIVLIPLVDNGAIENEFQEKNLFNFLDSQKELLKKLSLRVCFESDFSPKNLKRFISKYDEDLFGINYDIGNSASLGFNPTEEFFEYGARIINVHIKDRTFCGSTVPLGEGDADFPLIYGLLKDYNYKGNLILQTARAINENHLEVLLNFYNMTKTRAKKSGLNI